MSKVFAHIVPKTRPKDPYTQHPLPDGFDTNGRFSDVVKRAEIHVPEGYRIVGFRTELPSKMNQGPDVPANF